MNIIIACDGLFAGKGGMERLAIELANNLKDTYNCLLVSTGVKNNSYVIDENINVIEIDLKKIEDSVAKLKAFHADLYIYFCTNHRLLAHTVIAKKLEAKIIITESASPMRITYTNWLSLEKKNAFSAAFERYSALNVADAIRLEVEESLVYFPKFLQKKLKYFPNGTSFADQTIIVEKNKRNTILFVGPSKIHKRFDIALKAFNELINHEEQNAELLVAGVFNDSKYKKECIDFIKEHNLDKCITFTGPIDNMEELYSQAKVHIICSADESFGLVTIESMSFGVPTIGCAQSIGTRNLVVDGNNGLLYDDVENYLGLSQHIKSLLIDNILYKKLSENCLKQSKKYMTSLYYANWKNLIEDVHKNEVQYETQTIQGFLPVNLEDMI